MEVMRMVSIMRLLFHFEREFTGDTRFITGNALRHALGLQLHASTGIFTTKARLERPETYEDFFSIRTEHIILEPHFEFFWDHISQSRNYRCFYFPNCVSFDVIDPPPTLIDYIESRELIQLGGKRNCGFGIVTLQDHVEIDSGVLKLPATGSHITLLSPMVYLPRFVDRYDCRHETLQFWNRSKVNHIRAVSPGQFFRIKKGRDITAIARRGLVRHALLGQFGFGEYIVMDWKN